MKIYIVENWKEFDSVYDFASKSINVVKEVIGNLKIYKTKTGKPYLKNDERFINWSHSENLLVIALSNKSEIGIDIEDSNIEYKEDLHDYVLNEEEKNKIKQGEKFSKIWTMKESFLKYKGIELNENINNINVYNIDNITFNSFNYRDSTITICSNDKDEVDIDIL